MTAFVHLLLILLPSPSAPAGPDYTCLPSHVRPSDIVSAEWTRSEHPKLITVTVAETLKQAKARCVDGRLVDRNKIEIRFYRRHCFGAPTTYALETMHREQSELATLREHYTVIAMTCSPNGQPIP